MTWFNKGPKKVAPTPAAPFESRLNGFVWMLNRSPVEAIPQMGLSGPPADYDDLALVQRVQAAYRHATANYKPTGSGWDIGILQLKKDVHNALLGDDVGLAGGILRNPAQTTHFWGFDAIALAPAGAVEPHENVIRTTRAEQDWQHVYGLWLIDGLKSLAEAIGARRVAYPETEKATIGFHDAHATTADQILDQIDAELGISLTFPNPFAGELGLTSSRGIVGFRAIQAVYQAWRIAQIARGRADFRVLEIGAGLGRTAYFASLFGVANYSIVDIPLTNAAQGYFLGRTLGPDTLSLQGEERRGPLTVITPTTFFATIQPYDLIVNIDSFTEMDPITAHEYWEYAKRSSNALLSINHEHNPSTFRSIYRSDPGVQYTRHPYWMRRGYVEEFLTW